MYGKLCFLTFDNFFNLRFADLSKIELKLINLMRVSNVTRAFQITMELLLNKSCPIKYNFANKMKFSRKRRKKNTQRVGTSAEDAGLPAN